MAYKRKYATVEERRAAQAEGGRMGYAAALANGKRLGRRPVDDGQLEHPYGCTTISIRHDYDIVPQERREMDERGIEEARHSEIAASARSHLHVQGARGHPRERGNRRNTGQGVQNTFRAERPF